MCFDSNVEMKLPASLAISAWLYPQLGFDGAYYERNEIGNWNNCWRGIGEEIATPSFDEAIEALVNGFYLTHIIQLILEYPGLCGQAKVHRGLLNALKDAMAGKVPVLDKTLAPELRSALIKLGTDEVVRKRACRMQVLRPGQLEFLNSGPVALFKAAEMVLRVFSNHNIPALLTGSLALFIQRPFRLSPDIDITIARNMSTMEVDKLVANLEGKGLIFTERIPGYLAAQIPEPMLFNVDMEIGTAYHQIEVMNEQFIARSTFTCGGCAVMSVEDIINLKKKSGRPKDLMDIAFMESTQ